MQHAARCRDRDKNCIGEGRGGASNSGVAIRKIDNSTWRFRVDYASSSASANDGNHPVPPTERMKNPSAFSSA